MGKKIASIDLVIHLLRIIFIAVESYKTDIMGVNLSAFTAYSDQVSAHNTVKVYEEK